MKLRLLIIPVVAALLAAAVSPSAAAAPAPVSTSAEAAALIDVESGRLLYSHNGDKRMRIASLTKIMTAIVAIEYGDLSDIVRTSSRAAGKEGSSIYLRAGEEMSLINLLYGLMLRSGNDAAVAIAEHVGGSEEGFVHLMNEKARELGLENTHFANPHGLDQDDHYSSANDLAKLTAYALRNPVFREIVKTRVRRAPNPNAEWDYVWTNKNKMLHLYEGADGVKTGYTKKAGRCLVSSATRGGQQLAAVTLNDGDDWADHRRLLDWGFRHYPLQMVVEEGRKIAGYRLAAERAFRYPLAEGERERITMHLRVHPQDDVRTRLGDVGQLEFRLDGERIGAVPLRLLEEPGGADREGGNAAAPAAGGAKESTSRTLLSALRTVGLTLLLREV
ncbi:MAG: peptidase M15 [Thermobacillus sp. ZCTH02-B1]|uniref:D-alanyl-D-alanine carboxypeptidase family protein n=1 Tax=Thermobacillus sp. ZCTH02-B1 TaxID=1858795 RepID=UPI000B55B64F|nr:D-alanyl-D-alanine carboxypeptidase family protein [Thermobacillus sp. ZCTH02-B1]OUM96823.1 MAG: peptidase M15 [Thermobacillus sp. ZCTH02-B1]